MRHFSRYIVLFLVFFAAFDMFAQNKDVQDMHKVKRSETIFGIARKYGITVSELIKANPEMNDPNYELKKGDYIIIPKSGKSVASKSVNTSDKAIRTSSKSVKVGVLLPLHNVDGDGRRMLEYYRGLLMACDDLKKEGLSIEINACNLPIDGNVYQTLSTAGLNKADVIFGPLYTKQVKPIADFAKDNGSKLVIPFSINGNDVASNSNIFQVYQSPEYFYNEVIKHFVYRFSNYHVVVIDCNDRTSDKGVFTFGLRKELEARNISCNVTNLNSSDAMFAKSFSAVKPNMVILNTGRSPELNQVLERLDALTGEHPSLAVSLFGYTEWLMYVKYNQEKFFKYDTYIPTAAYYNSYSTKVKTLENRYMRWFKSSMMDYLPRFALTGYDHGMFFLRGIYNNGKKFNGSTADKNAVQTPLHFTKLGSGGYQNAGFMFVHYNRNNTISLINF